ncbi:MAG: conserved rane protein of unknown function [Hyphomicrobiales bacterium]|nr:conserved rane protein of unknown function [Hyphomicrobiales bacterium]
MLDIIAPAGPDALWTTLLLTVILGGAASAAAGRAVARSWRRPRVLVLYAFLLACAFGFLDYALFDNPVIPLFRLGEDLAMLARAPGAALADLPRALAGLGVNFVFLLAVGLAAYARTRSRQMAVQYGFMASRLT